MRSYSAVLRHGRILTEHLELSLEINFLTMSFGTAIRSGIPSLVNAKKKVLVVGGGLGGLATAIRLQAAGCDVEIWEKNSQLGGKLQERTDGGFRWDTGPSLLTMPQVLLDLFASAGKKMSDYIELIPLANTCRYTWPDGTVINEDQEFWRKPAVKKFIEYARGIYDVSGEAFLNHPPSEFWRAFSLRTLSKLRHLPKVMTFQTLVQKVDSFFEDPYLRQIFYRFATYNGSSPYLTPATFNIIPYVEHHFGGWYPKGGMIQVARALIKLAEEVGVRISLQSAAASFDGINVSTGDGRRRRPDFVVCNQDVLAAAQTWLKSFYSEASTQALLRPPLSCSGFVLYLGVNRAYSQLAHHNIFFTQDYRREFWEIFERRHLPHNPTIYVAATAKSDPDHAPPGQENLFVLINSPSLPSGSLSETDIEAYGDKVIKQLEAFGLTNLSGHIAVRHAFTSQDFATRDGSYLGSLYGWASHSVATSLFRPPLQHPRVKNLFFVGGTTHPGGGIPLVLLSGKMVATKILRRC